MTRQVFCFFCRIEHNDTQIRICISNSLPTNEDICSSVIITWIVCYSACAKVLCSTITDKRKALGNIDLNQMSHRYSVSGVLQNDWNDTSTSAHLRCKIWVSLSYKTVNIVVSSLYYSKNVKSVRDSAVLHWTMRLMVFPRNVGFSRCYLVSTRHEILSNIDRILTGTDGCGYEKTEIK